ncbi:MAG: MerR family transcriptional regulator [Alistipes sp.]|nr:MerR family transcriptional regulator [Alistipes sp.]
MAEKLFYSMGEVAEMFDVNQSLIRYWESQFDILRPKKNKKGNRMFRPEDIANFRIIYHLVKERGMTLAGAKRAMKQRGKESVSCDAELMERLQAIRSLLVEVREILKDDAADDAEYSAEAAETVRPNAPTSDADEDGAADGSADATDASKKAGGKKGVVTVIESEREPDGEERRPDLPFYEQTLF